MIKENGEIFGAYRAVGQGGIAERVMQAMTGSERFVKNESAEQVGGALEEALQTGHPVVALLGRKPILPRAGGGKSPACRDEKLVRECPLLHGAGLRWEGSNGHARRSMGEVSGAGWRFPPPSPNLCARISRDYYDGVAIARFHSQALHLPLTASGSTFWVEGLRIRRGLATHQGVICRAANHVRQSRGFEWRSHEIEGSSFDDRHVKLSINFLPHDNDADG